jgi:maleate cis-trans isomerase
MKKTPTVGFISAPAWFDPAPSEFPTVIEENVYTQQAPLLLPDFDYQLESVASVKNELDICARSLAAMGCDIVAQVGSPFSWACVSSEQEARSRNESMAKSAGTKSIMTGLAIIDGLRFLGAKRIAINCTYYEAEWRDAFASFLRICGFEVVHVSTLADQGFSPSDAKMSDYGWSMNDELSIKSILKVADVSPMADAIVVTGAGTRTLNIHSELESRIKRPIVAADTILYWAIAQELNLTLKPVLGYLTTKKDG